MNAVTFLMQIKIKLPFIIEIEHYNEDIEEDTNFLKTVPNLNLNIPDHTILDKIGEGGMSAVYLGRQISLQRKVAIKVLKKLVMEDKSLGERFVDEAKTVASLDHPHIISIYEAKKLPSGLAYFTMPYLTHGDFGEIICTNSDHLIELLTQICDGLSHAHKHGVIHRDLKPENILFDQFGRIKIADFGIAISKNAKRKTKETQLLGSAHYMSPEQIQSRDIDRQSDIYSLGCIIYEKLTGDHVFQASNDFSILMSHINKPIPDLPDALQEWQPIIDKCLAKDPDDRYSSVESLKDALLAIKYNTNKTPVEVQEPKVQTKKQPNFFWPAITAVSLLMVMVVILFLNSKTPNENKPELIAEKQALVAPIKEEQESEPLDLQISIVDESRSNEELIDLTGNLDNETLNQMSVEVKLEEAQNLLRRFRLTKPKGENAADKFQSILLEQPNNQAAKNGLNQVGNYYFKLIERKIDEQDFVTASKHIESTVEYIEKYNIDRNLFTEPVSKIINKTNQLVNHATQKRRYDPMAETYLAMSSLLMPDDVVLAQLKTAYQNIPKNSQVFNDKFGHEFAYFAVNVPGLKDFMVGTHEVTVEQFKRFAGERFTDEKCHHYDKKVFFKKTWLKPPFEQATTHPVICINAHQAKEYAQWYSAQTGANYRLPTQQEFVYLNNQLQTSNNCKTANLAGQEVSKEKKATQQRLNCNDGQLFTAPVESFTARSNVADLNGNVSEWVESCSNQTYCAIGNSWRSGRNDNNTQIHNESANATYSHIGFRLIKEF